MAEPTQRWTGRGKTAAAVLKNKMDAGTFDVFLCHNFHDKPRVKEIGEELKLQGVLPWLDEWELRPGLSWQRALEQQIEKVSAAAVFVGAEGLGPWQHNEIDAFLRQFADKDSPVIPVLLPDAPATPALPTFLRAMTWVDFRVTDPDPMERLLWGITGRRADSSAGTLHPEARTAPEPPPPNAPKFQPPPAANLGQQLIGSWQVQITNPMGMVGQMILQMTPDGMFHGQLPTPFGLTMVEGQWLLTAFGQLTLQGRQFVGMQVIPYMTMIQLNQTTPYQMMGFTSAGEQTVWQKMA